MNASPPGSRSTRRSFPGIAAALACALVVTACCGPARAEEPLAEAQARELAAQVLRETGNAELGAWTRSVIERALKRAGQIASTAETTPLPAERQARALAAARPNAAEVLVFASLSVPAASWREWAREAARIEAPLVLRGVGPEGFRGLVERIGARLGPAEAGVAIDPRLFRLFGVERVPAVAVVPGGVPACATRGCADDAPPPHDLVTGNIGLAAALEAIAAEGDAGRAVARAALARLTGGPK